MTIFVVLNNKTKATMETKKIFNGLTRRYETVEVGEFAYMRNGEALVRVERWGRSGKVLHRNDAYIRNGKESAVMGMGGATGHGWGGMVVGYCTVEECVMYNVK